MRRIHLPEFGGGTALHNLEHADERGHAGETAGHRDIRHGKRHVSQGSLRAGDPFLIQIFVKGGAGKLLEQSCEMVL